MKKKQRKDQGCRQRQSSKRKSTHRGMRWLFEQTKGENDKFWFNSKLIFHYKVLQGQSVLPLADVKVSGDRICFASKSRKTLNVLL